MQSVDRLDLDILMALSDNARVQVAELARLLDTPMSTIRDRIRKLEEADIIRGYHAAINYEKLGLRVKAVIQAQRAQTVSLEEILSEPVGLPEIAHVQLLTGQTDELITIYARDVHHMKDIIFNRLSRLAGLVHMSTAIVLDERSWSPVRHLEELLVGTQNMGGAGGFLE